MTTFNQEFEGNFYEDSKIFISYTDGRTGPADPANAGAKFNRNPQFEFFTMQL